MTSSSRRALPWMISLGAHLAAAAVLALVLAAPLPPLRVPSVDLSLVGGDGPGGRPAASKASRPRLASAGITPTSSSAATTTARMSADSSPASAAQPQDTAALPAARPEPPLGSSTAPAASDVLADVASVSPGSGAVPGASDAGTAGSGTWGWQGLPRKLIRKQDPEFPATLRAQGQEIEGEARITVAQDGTVKRVEITRSSGYIEIDASVAEALRNYLFSRVDGRLDSVGTVQFRFRLEKQD